MKKILFTLTAFALLVGLAPSTYAVKLEKKHFILETQLINLKPGEGKGSFAFKTRTDRPIFNKNEEEYNSYPIFIAWGARSCFKDDQYDSPKKVEVYLQRLEKGQWVTVEQSSFGQYGPNYETFKHEYGEKELSLTEDYRLFFKNIDKKEISLGYSLSKLNPSDLMLVHSVKDYGDTVILKSDKDKS